MPTYAVMDETGVYPKYVTNGFKVPEGSIIAPDLLPSVVSKMMFINDEWVPRPEISDFTIEDTLEGKVLTTAAPNGTTCLIVDKYTGDLLATIEAENGFLTATFPDLGVYVFHVSPPLPTIPRMIEVDLT